MISGYTTYSHTQSTGDSQRETEAQALFRCATKLEQAQAEGVDYFDYCFAIRQNQKLWTVFQASLIAPESQLPRDLKDTLKGLSVYIDRRSIRAIAAFETSMLTVLININRQIAAGLMQREAAKAATTMNASASAMPPQLPQGGLNIAG